MRLRRLIFTVPALAMLCLPLQASAVSNLTVTSSSVSGGYVNGTLAPQVYASSLVFVDTSITHQHTCAPTGGGANFNVTTVTNDHQDVYNYTPVYRNRKLSHYTWSIVSLSQDPINGFDNRPAADPCPTGSSEVGTPSVVAASGTAYTSPDGGFTKQNQQPLAF